MSTLIAGALYYETEAKKVEGTVLIACVERGGNFYLSWTPVALLPLAELRIELQQRKHAIEVVRINGSPIRRGDQVSRHADRGDLLV